MARTGRVQLAILALKLAFLATAGLLFVIPVYALSQPAGADATDDSITASAHLPLVLWCLGCPIAFARRNAPWLRVVWTLGCVSLLLHVAVAFHLGHGWSHAAAWDHTRRVGGYGDGIFVNYAFALVWLADAVWACASLRSYRTRPRWLNAAIHAFLAFVVFNAAVVFGSEEARTTFVVVAAIYFPIARRLRRR